MKQKRNFRARKEFLPDSDLLIKLYVIVFPVNMDFFINHIRLRFWYTIKMLAAKGSNKKPESKLLDPESLGC